MNATEYPYMMQSLTNTEVNIDWIVVETSDLFLKDDDLFLKDYGWFSTTVG